MKVLWLSQHKPLPIQIERLKAKFGEKVEVVHDSATFTNAEELIKRFIKGEYEDWVVVLPLSVLAHLCELCERFNLPKPLYPQMVVLSPEKEAEADLHYRGRAYKFVKFRRVKRLVLEFEESF